MVKLTQHFTEKELACPLTGKFKFPRGFLDRLETLRVSLGSAMTVNSCCRSFAHNQDVGGHERSLHVYDMPHHPTGGCIALDIAAESGKFKGDLIEKAWSLGWSVGVAKTFVHIDDRTNVLNMPQVLYTY